MMENPRTRTNRIFFLVDPEGKNDPAGLPETHFKKCALSAVMGYRFKKSGAVLRIRR